MRKSVCVFMFVSLWLYFRGLSFTRATEHFTSMVTRIKTETKPKPISHKESCIF